MNFYEPDGEEYFHLGFYLPSPGVVISCKFKLCKEILGDRYIYTSICPTDRFIW